MKAFFKTFYRSLEAQLSMGTQQYKDRESVWEQLYDWNTPIAYNYFLTHTVGKVPKAPSFSLPQDRYSNSRPIQITVEKFLDWEGLVEVNSENLEDKARYQGDGYCPIAQTEENGWLLLGTDWKDKATAGVFYDSESTGFVQLADNLLEFLQKCTKRTPWTTAQLLAFLENSAIEQRHIQLSNFEDFPLTRYEDDILLIQQFEGELEYLFTRSTVVLYGSTTKIYWWDELRNTSIDRMQYMQLAVNKIQSLSITLDFGEVQEQLLVRHLQEYRAVQKLLDFIIKNSRRMPRF